LDELVPNFGYTHNDGQSSSRTFCTVYMLILQIVLASPFYFELDDHHY
jgi:hypothetical protein